MYWLQRLSKPLGSLLNSHLEKKIIMLVSIKQNFPHQLPVLQILESIENVYITYLFNVSELWKSSDILKSLHWCE